jgi:hypothetical protein
VTTIAQLVIQASVEPYGVKTGLDQALGYTRQYAATADQIFKGVGPNDDVVTKAQLITRRIENAFLQTNNRLKEQFLRGALDPARYAQEARQAGLAMNTALLGALEGFRTKGIFDLEAENVFIAKLRTDLAGVRQMSGGGISDMTKTTGLISDLGRLSHGGAAGLGLMRREMLSLFAQMSGTIPMLDRLGNTLLSYQTGGAISFGVIAGLTAIAGAYYLITKGAREAAEENKKALESIQTEVDKTTQHISERALLAAETNVKAAQERVDRLQRDLAGRTSLSATNQTFFNQSSASVVVPDQTKTRQELADANRVLQAAIQNRDKIQHEGRMNSQKDFDAQLTTLIKHDNATKLERQIALDNLRNYQREAATLAKTGADNERRVFVLNQIDSLKETLFPKQDVRDKEPFPQLRAQIQNISTAYRDLREQGIAPTITLQDEAENQFLRLGRMISLLPDQTGRAARSLLEMQRMLVTAGIHANDAILTPQIQIGPPIGDEDKQASELTRRAAEMRVAEGALSDAAGAALGAEARFLRVIDLRIENMGGPEHASKALIDAKAMIMRDLERAGKDVGDVLVTPEMLSGLHDATQETKEFFAASRRLSDPWNDVRASIQGVLDTLDALGVMNDDIRQIANGALHLASSLKQIQKDRADRSTTSRDSVPGDGAASATAIGKSGGIFSGAFSLIGTVGQYMGAIGAGISIIKGITGLFSHHNQALEDNTKRLRELRESMVDTMGVGGQRRELSAIQNLRTLYASGQFKVSGSDVKNQMIEQAVNRAGLSIDQFNKIMSDFGIVPEKSGEWLNQLSEAINLATAAATRYSNTLDDQRSLLDLRSKVENRSGEQDAIKNTITLLNQFAPTLGAALNGIDTTTDEGRVQLREALKNFVTMIETNAITPEMLGTLTGVKDFGQLVGNLADSLNGLEKTTDKLNNAMSANIPSWYKLGKVRLESADVGQKQTPGTGTTPVAKPTSTPVDQRPSIPLTTPQLPPIDTPIDRPTSQKPMRPTDPNYVSAPIVPATQFAPIAPAPTSSADGTSNDVIIYGDVIVDAKRYTPEEIFDAVRSVGQRRSQTYYGTTKRWGEVPR